MKILNKNVFFFSQVTLFFISIVVTILLNNPIYLIIPFLSLFLYFLFGRVKVNLNNIFYLLMLCLPISIEWQVTNNLSLDFPTEPFLILLTCLVIAICLHKPNCIPNYVFKSNLVLFVLLLLAWSFINIFYSSHPILSLKYFVAKVWYIIPLVLMPQIINLDSFKIEKILKLTVMMMLFVILQSLLRHSFFEFSFNGIKNTLSPFFRNHVNYSATLVLLIPFFLVFKPKYVHAKAFKLNFDLYQLVFFVFILGLFFAYSRGAWLAIVFGFIGMMAIKLNLVKHFLIGCTALLLLFVGSLVYKKNYLKLAPEFNSTIYHENLNDHLQATLALKDVSNAERIHRWVAGVNMVLIHPIEGFGTNSFYYHYKKYTLNIFKTWVSNNKDRSTVHNYYLLVLIEQGIIGLTVFLILFIATITKAQKLYFVSKNKFHKQLALAIGTMFLMIGVLIFLSDLIETDKVGVFFWFGIGLIIWLENAVKKEKNLDNNSVSVTLY